MPIRVNLPDGSVANFPDGTPPADIESALKSHAAPQPASGPAVPQAQISQAEWDALPATEKAQRLLHWLGRAIGGSFLGGEEGVKAADHPGQTIASAVLPEVGGAVVKGIGKAAYKGGVALLPKTLKQQYPDMARAGYEEGIALTRRGMDKAQRLMGQSRQQADDLLLAAERSGAPKVSPTRVVEELRPVGQKIQTQTALGRADEMPDLSNRIASFLQQNEGGIPLTKAQALKREAQDLANTAYKARDKGAPINSLQLLTDEAQARGLRKGIEEIVPEVGPINARTQSLMGVARGAEHAAETGHILSRMSGAATGLLAGSGVGMVPAAGAALAGATLTTPAGLTRLALAAKSAGQVGPTVARAALLSQLLQQADGEH